MTARAIIDPRLLSSLEAAADSMYPSLLTAYSPDTDTSTEAVDFVRDSWGSPVAAAEAALAGAAVAGLVDVPCRISPVAGTLGGRGEIERAEGAVVRRSFRVAVRGLVAVTEGMVVDVDGVRYDVLLATPDGNGVATYLDVEKVA